MHSDTMFHDDFLSETQGQGGNHNPLKWVQRAFRGRYKWAILLGATLGLPMAVGGYLALPPTFTSTGIIEVSPTLPVTLYDNAMSNVPPMYDQFVQTQASKIRTSRVLDRALDHEQMRQVGWPRGYAGRNLLERTLGVSRPRRAQLIEVSVTHPDATLAKVATNAVLDAFMELEGDREVLVSKVRETELQERVDGLRRERSAIDQSIRRIASEYGTDDLAPLHDAEIRELSLIDDALTNLRLQIDALEARAEATQSGEPTTSLGVTQSELDQLRMLDPQLDDRLESLDSIEQSIQLNSTRFGPGHRTMRRLAEQRDLAQRRVDERLEVLRGQVTGVDSGAGVAAVQAQIQNVRDQLAQTIQRQDRVAQNARDIGNKRLEINDLKRQASVVDERIAETARALDAVRTERPNLERGRVQVVQRGEHPFRPSTDRRVALAGFAGVAGTGMGICIVGLYGFTRRGYRYLDELEDLNQTATLLGTLPDLAAPDDEQNQIAALAVHHIRNMLHVLTPSIDGQGRVFAVTSASSGEGKTSLSLALGMSFSLAGQRTLMLDADLIGRGLSSQLGHDGERGLSDCIEAGSLEDCIHECQGKGLKIMPAGSSFSFDPERLSEQAMRRLIGALRDDYDTILIDTGPILGSLEADIVCALADRSVLTVSRGKSPKLVQSSLARLKHLGARSIGIVFNRATTTDITKSISHVSIHSESIRALPSGKEARSRTPTTPLALAVGDKQRDQPAEDAHPSAERW